MLLWYAMQVFAFTPVFYNPQRGFDGLDTTPDGYGIISGMKDSGSAHSFRLPADANNYTFRLRLADGFTPGKSLDMLFCGIDTLSIHLSAPKSDQTFNPTPRIGISANTTVDTLSLTESSGAIANGTALMLTIRVFGNACTIALDSNSRQNGTTVKFAENPRFESLQISVPKKQRIEIEEITLLPTDQRMVGTVFNPTDLGRRDDLTDAEKAIPTQFPLDGLWQIYDYEIEDTLASIDDEAKYLIAGHHKGDKIFYEIILSSSGDDMQTPGTVKAMAEPSGIEGIWKVTWLSRDNFALRRGVRLTTESWPLLTVNFTAWNSKFRLIKINGQQQE